MESSLPEWYSEELGKSSATKSMIILGKIHFRTLDINQMYTKINKQSFKKNYPTLSKSSGTLWPSCLEMFPSHP